MSSYKFLYLFWLIPAYLLFLTGHQTAVYLSVKDTYTNGESYIAKVMDYNLKQIGAQNNAYVVLQFQSNDGTSHTQKLALPVEMVHTVNESNVVPIRYKKSDLVDIVLIPAYDTQKGIALMNMGIALVGFFIVTVIAYFVHRFARKKSREGSKQLIIQQIDDA